MERIDQLKDKDVRQDAPSIDPTSFLDLYVKSNFPQTAAIPSKEQRELGIFPPTAQNDVKLNKKPTSGTGFDNPASS